MTYWKIIYFLPYLYPTVSFYKRSQTIKIFLDRKSNMGIDRFTPEPNHHNLSLTNYSHIHLCMCLFFCFGEPITRTTTIQNNNHLSTLHFKYSCYSKGGERNMAKHPKHGKELSELFIWLHVYVCLCLYVWLFFVYPAPLKACKVCVRKRRYVYLWAYVCNGFWSNNVLDAGNAFNHTFLLIRY